MSHFQDFPQLEDKCFASTLLCLWLCLTWWRAAWKCSSCSEFSENGRAKRQSVVCVVDQILRKPRKRPLSVSSSSCSSIHPGHPGFFQSTGRKAATIRDRSTFESSLDSTWLKHFPRVISRSWWENTASLQCGQQTYSVASQKKNEKYPR